MARATRSKVVKDLSIQVHQHGARDAYRLLAVLGRTVGPMLNEVMSTVADLKKQLPEGEEITASTEIPNELIGKLFGSIDPDEIIPLAMQLLAHTLITVDDEVLDMSQGADFDKVFSGKRLALLPPVLKFSIEVNFSDFFSGALSNLKGDQEDSASKSLKSASPSGPATVSG